jgi:hypothetical protein
MASKPEDTDVLVFFVRQYFMRNSYPLRRHSRSRSRSMDDKSDHHHPKEVELMMEKVGEKGELLL